MASAKANPANPAAFDLAEAARRFEFGDDPARLSSSSPPRAKSKKGRLFGKFGRGGKSGGKSGNGNGSGSGNQDESPSKNSFGSTSATSTTASLNSSVDSARYEYVDGRVLGHSGDIAAGPQAKGRGSQKGASPAKSPPRGGLASQRGGAASTSGYVSEVSEFSFDRVTVTTDGTNQSSNVSWGFLDDGVLAALGGGQDGTTAPRVVAAEDPTPARAVVGHRRVKQSSDSTFSNVSLSSDEDLENIPCTGVVNDGAQSVISEISERTGGAHAGGGRSGSGYGGGGASDAVRAILEEGMEGVRQRERRRGGLAKIREGGGAAGEPSPARGASRSAAGGSRGGRTRTLLEDVRETYHQFKTDRNRGAREKPTLLQSLLEDVQFCGLYLCGIDAAGNDGECDGTEGLQDDSKRRRRDERKRQADSTFLGKVVRCGEGYGCGEEQ